MIMDVYDEVEVVYVIDGEEISILDDEMEVVIL